MTLAVARDKRVGFTTNKDYFEKAKAVAKANGMTISSAMDRFVKQVAITGKMELLDEKEILFQQLQGEIRQAIDDYESSVNTFSAEEVRKRLGL
ncbi:hypothetical protein AB1I63_07000 [Streptococcus pneumoniae]